MTLTRCSVHFVARLRFFFSFTHSSIHPTCHLLSTPSGTDCFVHTCEKWEKQLRAQQNKCQRIFYTLNWICLCHIIYYTHYTLHVPMTFIILKCNVYTMCQNELSCAWAPMPVIHSLSTIRAYFRAKHPFNRAFTLIHSFSLYPNWTVVMATIPPFVCSVKVFHSLSFCCSLFVSNIVSNILYVCIFTGTRFYFFIPRISRSIYFLCR